MINILSSYGDRQPKGGPGKLFANLIKGLEMIHYPYVVNRDIQATRRLWIHDRIEALYDLRHVTARKVLGPNLFVMPGDIPGDIDMQGAVYIQPCDWAKRVWEHAGFKACPIQVWPVGIDTEKFQPSRSNSAKQRVMIYHKQRDPAELGTIVEVVKHLRLPYNLIRYGEYSEDQYIQALHETTFIIWHGGHESQGLALEEAMACDVPILVCDVSSLSQSTSEYNFPAAFHHIPVTTAPYFNENCGLKIKDLSTLPESIEHMMATIKSFRPREYVLNHLSLDGQARAFIAIWERWGLSLAEGIHEITATQRKWRAPLGRRIGMAMKRKVQKIQRTMRPRVIR